MSTKKRLIDELKKCSDMLYNPYPILKGLITELESKQKTPVTKEILYKNGFKEYPYGLFEFKDDSVEFDIEWDYDGCYWCDTVLRNVADLEDALDFCGCDKDIELAPSQKVEEDISEDELNRQAKESLIACGMIKEI